MSQSHTGTRSLRPRRTRLTAGVVYVILVLALISAPAFAGRNGNGNGGNAIWLEQTLSAQSTDGGLHHGDPVSFGFTSRHWDDVTNTGPWLRLECYLGGSRVYFENRAGFEGGYRYGEPFTLGPSLAWPEGEADCQGILGHYHDKTGKFRTDAVVDFHVMP